MKKGLFFYITEFIIIAGTADTMAACIPTNNCDDLGYKYTAEDCSGEGIACPFDVSKYNCANPCTYTMTAADCSSQCRNAGTNSCVKKGTTYYETCGISRCSDGYSCINGTCKKLYEIISCCDDTGNCCSTSEYSGCKTYYNYSDCSSRLSQYENFNSIYTNKPVSCNGCIGGVPGAAVKRGIAQYKVYLY